MKKLYMTDDRSVTQARTVRVECECGWLEKMYAETQSVHRIDAHIRDRHNEGVVIYRGTRFFVGNKVSLKDALEFKDS